MKLFSDDRLAGSYGGSSQCYHIHCMEKMVISVNLVAVKNYKAIKFIRVEDAIKEGLAYEQTEMVKVAVKKLNH